MPIRRAISSPVVREQPGGAAGRAAARASPRARRRPGAAIGARLVLAAARRERHAVPEGQLGVVGLRRCAAAYSASAPSMSPAAASSSPTLDPLVGAPQARAGGAARRGDRGGPPRAGPRAGPPPAARWRAATTTTSAADWRPRMSPPSPRRPRAPPAGAPPGPPEAGGVGPTIASGTVSRSIMLAWALTASPTRGPPRDAAPARVHRHAPARVDHRDLAHGLLLVVARAAGASAAGRTLAVAQQARARAARRPAPPPTGWPRRPRPPRPSSTIEPTAKKCDWTATPSSPLDVSRATIE